MHNPEQRGAGFKLRSKYVFLGVPSHLHQLFCQGSYLAEAPSINSHNRSYLYLSESRKPTQREMSTQESARSPRLTLLTKSEQKRTWILPASPVKRNSGTTANEAALVAATAVVENASRRRFNPDIQEQGNPSRVALSKLMSEQRRTNKWDDTMDVGLPERGPRRTVKKVKQEGRNSSRRTRRSKKVQAKMVSPKLETRKGEVKPRRIGRNSKTVRRTLTESRYEGGGTKRQPLYTKSVSVTNTRRTVQPKTTRGGVVVYRSAVSVAFYTPSPLDSRR